MASLRRSKVLSPDGQTAKFLYTIIKQLDLKSIDWNEVASGLDITNGHAARMRYSRFKAQIEGLPTQSPKPRAPRPKKDASSASKGKGKNKPGYEPGKVDGLNGEDDDGDVKMEHGAGPNVKKEGEVKIKQEAQMTEVKEDTDTKDGIVKVKSEPTPANEYIDIPEESVKVKHEPVAEPIAFSFSPASGIAAMDLNPYPTSPPAPHVSTLGFSSPPAMPYPQRSPFPSMPPQATVSLADLQLPPIPKTTGQMPLPTFSYPLSPMDFDFDFNAPVASLSSSLLGSRSLMVSGQWV